MESAPAREYGRAHVRIVIARRSVRRIADETEVWMSHGDQVTSVSRRFSCRWPQTDTCPIAAVKHRSAADLRPAISSRSDAHAARARRSWPIFSRAICGCTGTWRLSDFAERNDRAICDGKSAIDRVICGLSGGVDSSVVAALLYRGDRLAVVVHPGRQRPVAQRRRRIGDSRVHRRTSRPICTWCMPRTNF